MQLKPSLDLEQQINAIEAKGFHVDNRSDAKHFPTRVGYYRLRAYILPFRYESGRPSFRRISWGSDFKDSAPIALLDPVVNWLHDYDYGSG